MTLTRNGLTLWIASIAALVGYLVADGRPPTIWHYGDWLKFLAAACAWGIGKLQSSPLPSKDEATAQTVSVPRP